MTSGRSAGVRTGLREAVRNRVLWPLLVAVPVVFVLLAVATTPDEFEIMQAAEGGRLAAVREWLPDVHGGTMAPIATGSLAALAGLRRGNLLTGRLVVVAASALLATAAALAVTTVVFDAAQWGASIAATVHLALTYALIGALLGRSSAGSAAC